MTEKRFEETYGEMGLFRVKDNKTGKYYKAVLCGNPFTETDKPILDVLNEIAEENEQLKQAYVQLKHRHSLLHDVCIDAECDRDMYRKDIASLEKENKELKTKVDFYKYFQKDARELEKENEQLKSTIKEVTELLNEEVDLFSDKALEHDICAYMELRELDNKDAYYMATATKKAIKMLKELLE